MTVTITDCGKCETLLCLLTAANFSQLNI